MADYSGWTPFPIPQLKSRYYGHGTTMAAIAAGTNLGVASRAEVVCVKVMNGFKSSNPSHTGPYSLWKEPSWNAFQHAFMFIIGDIKKNPHPEKSVVMTSLAIELETNLGRDLDRRVSKFVKDLEDLNVLFVVAAGNDGQVSEKTNQRRTLDEQWPTNLGSRDNNVVTVGGADGRYLWPHTTPARKNQKGSMTVYASVEADLAIPGHADDLDLPRAGYAVSGPFGGIGTSNAAPAIAGLAAYFLSLPSLENRQPGRKWTAHALKQYIVELGSRILHPPGEGIKDREELDYRDDLDTMATINDINIGYNRAPDGLCAMNVGILPKSKSSDSIVRRASDDQTILNADQVKFHEQVILDNGKISSDFDMGFVSFYHRRCGKRER
ncbi:peptidase S8/S53 domain-containing protein [Clohesyomyces aquaticus]|uniref:Peptidase S8/S53 domain-containing protein n=1 Tax=Clohesyomyces aquaticus TaxID=1231657 RepID=A0A1Y1ZLD4_9PLEO|nr:peptidase S8/S53 domain-containing protein [Clohesyomyces aquaticus]